MIFINLFLFYLFSDFNFKSAWIHACYDHLVMLTEI